jgi:hypothetical protein
MGQSSAGQSSATASDTAEPDTAEPDTAEPDTAEPDTAEPDTAEPDTGQSTAESVSVTEEEPATEGAWIAITAEPVRSGITLTSLTRSCHGPHGQTAIPYTKIVANSSDIFGYIEDVF